MRKNQKQKKNRKTVNTGCHIDGPGCLDCLDQMLVKRAVFSKYYRLICIQKKKEKEEKKKEQVKSKMKKCKSRARLDKSGAGCML